MRHLRKTVLAGAAAIALVGVAGLAVAAIKNAHVLDVRLPDGSLAHIRYVGDTPPTVTFAAAPPAHIRYVGDTPPTVTFAAAPPALSILSRPFDPLGPGSPFAALDQISQ